MLYWYYKKEGRCVTVKRSLLPVLSMLFFDRLCRRGGILGGCAVHGCPAARDCGDRRDRRGRGDARTHR